MTRLTDKQRQVFADKLMESEPEVIELVAYLMKDIEAMMRRPGYTFPWGYVFSSRIFSDLARAEGGSADIRIEMQVMLPGSYEAIEEIRGPLDREDEDD